MNETTPSAPAVGAPAAAPSAPRRRRLLRRLVKLVVVLLLLVFLAPLALHLPFVRSWVASRASRAVGAPVEIAGASAWWWSGIDLEGVTVGSPKGHEGTLAHVERVHVDVRLARLLGGDVDARVEVTRPLLTLRRRADGRWNLQDLGRDAKEDGRTGREPGPQERARAPEVALTVVDGTVEAHGLGGRVERISGIELGATLAADGAVEGTFEALAEGAGLGGGDVRITLAGGRREGEDSPLEALVPDLDLGRLAGVIEGFTGLEGLRGTARLEVRGTLTAGGGVRGKVVLAGQGFEARLGTTRVALGSVKGTVDVTQGDAGDTADANLLLERVEVTAGEGADAKTLAESKVTAVFRARRDLADRIEVPRLDVAAGSSLTLKAANPLQVSADGPAGRTFQGRVELQGDLARLAALRTFVPALTSLKSGVLGASIDGRAAEGLDVGIGARVTDLALAPGDLAPDGYEDRDVTLQARIARNAAGEITVQVHQVASALARVGGPFKARLGADGALTFDGPLDLTVHLDALSRLLGRSLGLAAGERLRGTLSAKGTAGGSADDGRLTATLAGRDLVFPASWSAAAAPASLDGALGFTWTRSSLLGEVKGLRGLGLSVEVRAALRRDATSTAFDGADVTLAADLGEVRARFGPRLGLAPGAALAGRLETTLKVDSLAEGRRLAGTTKVAALSWRSAPDGTPLDEPALTFEHTLLQPHGTEAWRGETLRLRGNGYALDLSGSSFGPSRVDVKGELQGEAARLAERTRALLGPDYRDLTGTGEVRGRVAFASAGEDLLAAGTADADLALGTWSAAGATLAGGRLTAKRAAGSGPYRVALTGTLNQGPASVTADLEPAGEALRWRLLTALKGVDLSTVLVNQGAGKWLGYVLPTLVPTDKTTPVLSGRLDADVDLGAADLSGEPMLASLAGRGNVALTEGTLGESTLFSAMGAGDGLGDVGKALQKVVPEVGQELANFQRSVAFQSLVSRFEVGGRRIDLKETRLVGSALRIDGTGTVDFEQQVNLAMRLWIGSKAGERLKTVVPDQTIPLQVTGRLDRPRVRPDLNAADLLKGAAQGLLPQPGESPEDVKRRLEEELKRRLKNPFK